MCKTKNATIRLPAVACLSAVIGVATLLSPTANAQVSCDPSIACGVSINPSSGSRVVAGQTVTINYVKAGITAGSCFVTNGDTWLAYPDGTTILQTERDYVLPISPFQFQCTGTAGGGGTPCLSFTTTYVVNQADAGKDLHLGSPTVIPRKYAQNGNNPSTYPGIPNQIHFFAASEGDAYNDAQFTSPSGLAYGEGQVLLILVHPGLSVTKLCDNTCTTYGLPIGFHGSVCNTGDVALVNISLSDTPTATIDFAATTSTGRAFDQTLNAGECVSYTGSYTPAGTGAALCGPFTDTIIASGTASAVTPPVSISATNSATCHVQTSPAITLTKDCYKTGSPGVRTLLPGDTYVEIFVVKNTGNVPLQNVVINDDKQGTITIGSLAVGQSVTNTQGPITPPAGFCGPITDHATASGSQICPADATCPSSPTVTSAQQTCTVTVVCPPAISVEKDVTCWLGTSCDANWGKSATGAVNMVAGQEQFPAFCYRFKVCNIGAVALTITSVTDLQPDGSPVPSQLDGPNLCGFVGTTLQPGACTAFCVISPVQLRDDLTNIVRVTGCSVAQPTNCVTASDTNRVILKPVELTCYKAVSVDGNPPVNVADGLDPSVPHTLVYSVWVTNTGELPLTDIIVTDAALGIASQPFSLLPGQAGSFTANPITVNCPTNILNTVTVTGVVDTNLAHVCAIQTNGVLVGASTECSAEVGCTVAASCRVTGGGRQDLNDPNGSVCPTDVRYVTHGGQVGAPVGNMVCAIDTSVPNYWLGNPCIHGRWTHVRHQQGGNEGNFHARFFDTLDCACLDTNMNPATCQYGPATVVNGICGDRSTGPLPRPAGANKIAFTGVGDWTCEVGKRAPRSCLFRVDIEDRGEPGNAHALSKNGKPNRVPDRYRIRIWVLTDAELAQLNSGSGADPYLINFRNCISACNGIDFQDGVCGPNTCSGSDCDGSGTTGTITFPGGCPVRSPNVDDGGELLHGNHQIHPMIKACDPLNPTGPGLAKP